MNPEIRIPKPREKKIKYYLLNPFYYIILFFLSKEDKKQYKKIREEFNNKRHIRNILYEVKREPDLKKALMDDNVSLTEQNLKKGCSVINRGKKNYQRDKNIKEVMSLYKELVIFRHKAIKKAFKFVLKLFMVFVLFAFIFTVWVVLNMDKPFTGVRTKLSPETKEIVLINQEIHENKFKRLNNPKTTPFNVYSIRMDYKEAYSERDLKKIKMVFDNYSISDVDLLAYTANPVLPEYFLNKALDETYRIVGLRSNPVKIEILKNVAVHKNSSEKTIEKLLFYLKKYHDEIDQNIVNDYLLKKSK